MTLQEIKSLQAYNAWANNRIFDLLSSLPAEQYMQDMKSSHGGIHGTLTHMVSAENIWLQRFKGPAGPPLVAAEIPSLAALKKIWEGVGFDTAKWLGMMTDKKLGESFIMKTSTGETFVYIYWQAFQHMVNHSSFHRGQIVTMLRQHGVQPVNTDLIRFYREMTKLAR